MADPQSSPAFRQAVQITVDRFEGGGAVTVDDGGITKWGIAQRYHKGVDVATLTRERAEAIYKAEYWDPLRCDEMPGGIGFLVFDMAVNPGNAVDLLQAELRVERDGVVGPDTLDACRRFPAVDLISGLTQRRLLHYIDETQRHPYKLKWLHGWLRRSAAGAAFAGRIACI